MGSAEVVSLSLLELQDGLLPVKCVISRME